MKTIKETKTVMLAQCALFAAIVCIFSFITVPIGPIPITLAIFAVMLTGIVLGFKKGAVAVIVYILIGVCGIPVFSGGKSGVAAIIGPTGGYIWSYIFMVIIIGFVSNRSMRNKTLSVIINIAGCILGTFVCYMCGTLQYSITANISFVKALSVCVLPFIVLDLIKAICASIIGEVIKTVLNKARLS